MCPPGLDLEDEDPVGTAAAAAEQQAANFDDETPGGSAAKGAAIVDDDADFGNEDDYRRPGELDVVKVTNKDTFSRISILINPETGKAFMKKGFIHYVQGKGYARCLSVRDKKGNFVGKPAFCCEAKEAEPRYGALCVEYLTVDPKTGKFRKDVPVEFEIKALMLGRGAYKEVSLLPGEDLKVTDLDILATPRKQGKGLTFSRMSDKASYTKDPKLNKAVLEATKPFLDGKELNRKVGKVVNKAEMKVHLGVGTAASDDGPGMDDLD